MKTIIPFFAKGKASILRLPLLILFVVFSSVMPGGAPVTANVNQASVQAVAEECDHCGVTDDDIAKYMLDFGYEVRGHYPEPGTCNVICETQNEYPTRVFIENGRIIDFEDIQ